MNLLAVPTSTHTLMIDCDECGPLGIIERTMLDTYIAWHLSTEHEIEPPLMNVCDCGYNYDHPTGDTRDKAYCNECAWTATGSEADHTAHHHHLDTRHIWRLEIAK